MKQKSYAALFFCAIGMAVLIIDSKTAITAGHEAISLCLAALIPSLFPFIFLSSMLTASLGGLKIRLLRPLGRLLHIPDGTESLLLIGLLGGYPVGAQCVNQAYTQHSLSQKDAERMLAFCNNCGPAFLFGIISRHFSDIRTIWLLWGVHVLSSILVAVAIPGETCSIRQIKQNQLSISQALMRALSVMAQICGWVILFRIVIAFVLCWFGFLIPPEAEVIICGLLELANGCVSLSLISDPVIRFIVCSGMIGLGGLCVTMQTFSLLSDTLDKKPYMFGKLLQSAYSILISIFLCFNKLDHKTFLISALICIAYIIVFFLFLRNNKNNSSILQPSAV